MPDKTVKGKDINNTNSISTKNLTASDGVTIKASNNGDLLIKKNSITLGNSAEHRLWV